MFPGQTPLFYVFSLVLQLKLAIAAVAAGCSNIQYGNDPVCEKTQCSKPARISYGDNFTCDVKRETEWDAFRIQHVLKDALIINDSNSPLCKPPLLSGISLHPLPYGLTKGVYSPAFNATFNVTFLGKRYKPEVKAVLLTFESPVFTNEADSKYTDIAYSVQRDENGNILQDNRRYRLFDFSSYTADTYDEKNPISIDYPCLYGLDDCTEPEKIYTITLTSIAMNFPSPLNPRNPFSCKPDTCANCSLRYTISAHPARYKNTLNHEQKWKMTIATSFYPMYNDINVIWETVETAEYYKVILLRNNYHFRQEKKTEDNYYTFEAVKAGSYQVQIFPCNTKEGCATINHKTHHPIIINDPGNKHTGEELFTIKIIAAVSGSLLGLILIGTISVLRRKIAKRNHSTTIEQPRYLILHNKDRASEYVSNALECALTQLEAGTVKCITDYRSDMTSDSFLLIVIPAEHGEFMFKMSNEKAYLNIIESLARTKKESAEKLPKTLIVYFPFIKGAKSVSWKCLKAFKRVVLIREFKRMLKLLSINWKNNPHFDSIQLNINSAIQKAEEVLRKFTIETNVKTPYQTPYCEIHDSKYPIHPQCPIRRQHPANVIYHPPPFSNQLSTRKGMIQNKNPSWDIRNNNITNAYIERVPLIGQSVIPPSPLPTEKELKKPYEPLRTISNDSSGYATSRQISSSSENNSHHEECEFFLPDSDDLWEEIEYRKENLEDDDSLNEKIIAINKSFLPKNSSIDRMIELNFFP